MSTDKHYIFLLYSPFQSEKDAINTAQKLIEQHLIACANIFSSTSLYQWNNEMKHEGEFVLVAKTSTSKISEARTALQRLHPYENPAILSFQTETNETYGIWVETQTT